MGRKFYLPLILISFFFGTAVLAQTAEIRGKVTEKGTNEGIPFASVAAFMGGSQVQGSVTDIDGNYVIKPLNPGKYSVKATSIGYSPAEVSNILVAESKTSFVNIQLGKGIDIGEVTVTEYTVPLIDKGNPATQKTMTFDDIQAAPVREVNAIASQAAGVYTNGREGDDLNIRGSRGDATAYYVDGVKVRGGLGVSAQAAEQITTITGGVPAQYGDATGGIISVTTRGPSKEYTGGVEFVTSELFDDYGYNLASFALSGPIATKRDSVGRKSGQPLAGFFVAGDYNYEKDPLPSAVDIYKVDDALLADIEQNPLVRSKQGQGFDRRVEYLTYDDMSTIKYHQNIPQSTYRLNGTIRILPVKNVTISLGGALQHADVTNYIRTYELFNYKNNTKSYSTSYRVFGKLTQNFVNPDDQSKSDIKNAFYTVQADYSQTDTRNENADHTDNLFRYGHVGTFKSDTSRQYRDVLDPGGNLLYVQQGPLDFNYVAFTPSQYNPLTANYTSQYYALAPDTSYYTQISDIQSNNGLVNGDNRIRQSAYNLYGSTGRVANGYNYGKFKQFRISASGSADIKNHNIVVGFEYEKRTDRAYNVSPNDLWTYMRSLSEGALTSGGQFEFNGTGDTLAFRYFGDTTKNVDNEVAPGFYENIHSKLGVPTNQWVDIDAYDPSMYSLDLFTPDELYFGGYVGSYGYDHLGNVTNTQGGIEGFNDFLTLKDANKNYIRPVAAFEPIYTAGYINDRITYNDLILNIGVRVDRYDANQPVLKDKYCVYDTYKAGDEIVKNIGSTIPSNIEDDYVVYVDNYNNPTKVVGYRKDDQWYDASGSEITNVQQLADATSTGTIQPYIKDPAAAQKSKISVDAFEDYDPQTTFMPRIAFSFPISDEAYFSAHYDVLTQRPSSSSRFSPFSYVNWARGSSAAMANPDLKPEKTTDYEISFQQKISNSSALTIAAFYKEMRDMIQLINVDYAFPIRYQTFGNIDFGTVKGLTFSYDLRRTSNVRMNISYTLQFAEGTGSNALTNSGLLSTQGQTNLREPKPLDFDQRHTFVGAFDYHYASGKDYNGPVWFGKQVFSNAGVNLVMRAGSGTPYTRIANPVQTQDPTIAGRTTLAGSINGSRLPWQFNFDVRFDKDFELKMGTKTDGSKKRSLYMSVYLQVLNLLNANNVTAVYSATGNPDDDGYLSSAEAQSSIDAQISPESYTTYYSMSVNSPFNYLEPRRIRLGVQLNF